MAIDQQVAVQRALDYIERCSDPAQLRTIMQNAADQGELGVRDAAFRRLCAVQPSAQPGTLEHAVWQSIFALEEVLGDERERTTRLARTRQKISRDGEQGTVRDLVLKDNPSEGFRLLAERDLLDLTFEALALAYADRFDERVIEAATNRLRTAGWSGGG